MLTIQHPGFENLTRDSQKTFRALLEALSLPGKLQAIEVALSVPEGLTTACAAACLTLMDLETDIWLQPGFSEQVKAWLQFHTGCAVVDLPEKAAFAVVHDLDEVALESFYWGSAEAPEISTTLLVQVPAFAGGPSIELSGPGILREAQVSPVLGAGFWQQWQQNHSAYPQGIDVFLFEGRRVMGLPRTVRAREIRE